MKVLQINAVYGYSSTGRMVQEFDEAFETCGIDSLVVTTRSNCQKDTIYTMGSYVDYKIHALFSRVFGKQGYFSARHTKKLLAFLEDEKPDIVHLGNLHSNFIHIPMLLSFLAEHDIATVLTLHDCFFYTGKCTHYITEGCNKWQNGCHDCVKRKADNPSWFFDKTAAMWHDKKTLFSNIPRLAVIGVSDWITAEAKLSFLNTAKIVKRIYNGIDIDCFHPSDQTALRTSLGLQDRFVVLGVAQRWSAGKGLHIFTTLAKALPDVAFVLIGELPAGETLPNNVMSLGVTDSVQKLAAFYAAADVFLNPSLCETFGKTTAEALASGTPVIGNNVTAIPELIPSECGFVIDPINDTEKIMEAIETVRHHSKAAYSEHCRAFAVAHFDKDDSINQYIQVYNELMAE